MYLKAERYFANKGPYSQSYGLSSSHIQMWELDLKEGWVLNNWCFQTVILEKTLESPLGCQEIKSVHPKGEQSWIFIGRTDADSEIPILWPPDAESHLTGKDTDAGEDWRQEDKGTIEDEMVGCHYRFNGHECEQTLRHCEGQGRLVCCSPLCFRVSYDLVTEQQFIFLGFPFHMCKCHATPSGL